MHSWCCCHATNHAIVMLMQLICGLSCNLLRNLQAALPAFALDAADAQAYDEK